jgi:hypothetical protein
LLAGKLERPAKKKHSSLFLPLISYEENEVLLIWTKITRAINQLP